MGLEKLELLAQKLIQLEDDYDAYEFSDTYDDYLPNLDNDKYDGIVGDTMSAIVNNSYEILNELEDMYYDVEDVDEEMANDILSLMDEVEIYSSYTPAERVSENKLLEEYLSKKEITMDNKFESIIRGRETSTKLESSKDESNRDVFKYVKDNMEDDISKILYEKIEHFCKDFNISDKDFGNIYSNIFDGTIDMISHTLDSVKNWGNKDR